MFSHVSMHIGKKINVNFMKFLQRRKAVVRQIVVAKQELSDDGNSLSSESL